MSAEDAPSSTLKDANHTTTTTLSTYSNHSTQLSGKRKRAGSIEEIATAEVGNDNDQSPAKLSENFHELLIDIVEILKRFVLHYLPSSLLGTLHTL